MIKRAATMIALSATAASAGGLSDPIVTPPVLGTPYATSGWGGAYAGLSFGQTEAREKSEVERIRRTPTTEDVEVITVEEEAVKAVCEYNQYGHSGGEKCDGFPTELVEIEFPGIDHCGRDYSQTCVIRENKDGTSYIFVKGGTGEGYEYATGEVITTTTSETVTVDGPDLVTTFSETIQAYVESGDVGGFIGYRQQYGAAVLGVEASADGTLSTAELSAGLAMGDVLVYGFAGAGRYDGLDGSVYGGGVDYRLSDSWTLGGKFTAGDFGSVETETAALRVSFNF